MARYYNADGVLEDFSEYQRKVKCKFCGKEYLQRVEEQVPGFRDKSYDICPYCKEENGSSMDEEYYNSKLED